MKIATIITSHNRKDKTIASLNALYKAIDCYNKLYDEKIENILFLTDDGCTDGTKDSIISKFSTDRNIVILNGDGNLYWAGGMRMAWRAAINCGQNFDFYLLLNDDTVVFDNVFLQLMELHNYAMNNYNNGGVYSGICCSSDGTKTTYGGELWTNKFLANSRLVDPIGKPQMCDMANANILLIAKTVVDNMGIFYKGYRHALADFDYTIKARKRYPVLLTSAYCGFCDNDHESINILAKKVISMSLKELLSIISILCTQIRII